MNSFQSAGSGLLVMLVSLLVGACSTTATPKGKTVSEEVYALIEKENKLPDFVEQALLEPDIAVNQPSSVTDTRFDVSVKDISAKTFFLSLISDVGVNVVTHPNVSGAISLELKNVTVADVLDVVRDVYGYEYSLKNNIYTVYPSELRTQIFPINYIDVKRVGISDTSVSIGEISSNTGGGSGNSGGGGGGQTNQAANILSLAGGDDNTGSGEAIVPGSRVQTLNNTNFWVLLKKTVDSIVDVKKEGRMVVVNPQSGLVVVTAMPNELSTVRSFLDQAELSVKRQVILETQIVEVRLQEGFEAGVDWGAIQGQLSYTNDITATTNYSDPLSSTLKQGVESFSTVFNVLNVRELLSLLETQGTVQVLSSPRVSTVNNQKALIRVGTDEFFVTGLTNNTTSSAAATTTSPEVELASFFSGISLDVTPQISEDGEVILHVHPIISDVNDQIKELSVGNDRISLPLAVRDVRESDSIVKVKNGQMVVLGGLMQRSSNNLDSAQPWLSKVPLLGSFFKHKKTQSEKTELVILMRPIVVEADTWDSELQKMKKYSNEMADEYRSR